jgi:hypothetical protein
VLQCRLCGAHAVIGEVVDQRDPALRQRLGSVDVVFLPSEPVVREFGLAVLHVEAPTTEQPTLRENHILSTALRDFKVGGDEDRATERVDENILGHAGHTGVEHHLRPAMMSGRPALVAFKRWNDRSSIGYTLYLIAS